MTKLFAQAGRPEQKARKLVKSRTNWKFWDAFCLQVRDPGVHEYCKHLYTRSSYEMFEFPKTTNHLKTSGQFLRGVSTTPMSYIFVEWESTSPFDSKFPKIVEIRTAFQESARDRMNQYCQFHRCPGVNNSLYGPHKPSEDHEDLVPYYMDPFHETFGRNIRAPIRPKSRRFKSEPRTFLPPVYEGDMESVSPFDDRFPALIPITVESRINNIPKKRRHRISHRERRARLIQKRLREYGRETIVRKRRERKAFRRIPLGLRFPSPGYKAPKIQITCSKTQPTHMKVKLPHLTSQVHIDSRCPPTLEPFPALTPIAARQQFVNQLLPTLSPIASPSIPTNRFHFDHLLNSSW
jgi:hypothetical protein